MRVRIDDKTGKRSAQRADPAESGARTGSKRTPKYGVNVAKAADSVEEKRTTRGHADTDVTAPRNEQTTGVASKRPRALRGVLIGEIGLSTMGESKGQVGVLTQKPVLIVSNKGRKSEVRFSLDLPVEVARAHAGQQVEIAGLIEKSSRYGGRIKDAELRIPTVNIGVDETYDGGVLFEVDPEHVHDTLKHSMLVEGYPFVLDLQKSHGQRIHDALTGRDLLDFFTFYASRPIAFDHPRLADPAFRKRLETAAIMKPSNGDIYTPYLAEFVKTFNAIAMGPGMKYLFFIDGGALAVENALKAAFDWKARKNKAAGVAADPDRAQVIHFKNAFHGRSGYTLSLTNTADPRKTDLFPKLGWPRITSPAAQFPLEGDNLLSTIAAEEEALREIDEAYARLGKENIACIIIEPIQAEGGDRHFRKEFLRKLREICDERDALLIFDEVQTGVGATGTMWYYEQTGVTPDIVAFAKKMQAGGIMAGPRLDEVDSVFRVKSRISSTFGGNLVDFVRATRYLEIIQDEKLLDNAKAQGAYQRQKLERLVADFPDTLSSPRAAGLMAAVDISTGELRDRIIKQAMDDGLVLLPCGERSIRFRPALDVKRSEIDEAMSILHGAIEKLSTSP